jgi:galactosylceramidase
VEIGGDAQTTDGTESSHQHEQNDLNYNRGYEWWLMQEAKKRNPNIKLYGLSWAFPAWVGNGSGSPYKYPNLTANYTANWILGAKSVYNLDIDYVGIWNERNYDSTYIKTLRSTLDSHNLKTQIVAADAGWEGISGAILSDADLAKAVSIIGAHYPGTDSDANAIATGKPLWASEDYSTNNGLTGGGCWARILNQNYVNGQMTATISWNLIASYYPGLPYQDDGLMSAYYPWNGHYDVRSPIWGSAHTTQFTQPGWYYLKINSGAGHLASGGSYVSFVNQQTKALTIVIEKMSHDHSVCIRPALPAYNTSAENATFYLKGSFASITKLSLWYTHHNYDNQDASIFFQKQADVTVTNGQFSLAISVDSIYTLTTTTGQQKGEFTGIPPAVGFPTTYTDDFEKYAVDSEADYFADQAGVWEIFDTTPDTHGKVMRQVVTERPICWANDITPVSVIGDSTWSVSDVAVDVYLEVSGGAAFVGAGITGTTNAAGYLFSVNSNGGWFLATNVSFTDKLTSGTTTAPGVNKWFRLRLQVNNGAATGSVNGVNVFSNFAVTSRKGWAAIGTGAYQKARFDNFALSGGQELCKAPYSGEEVYVYTCSGTSGGSSPSQTWALNGDGTISLKDSQNKLCFNATGKDSTSGDPDIFLAACDASSAAQVYTYDSSTSTIKQKSTGNCLDIVGQSTEDGARVELYPCNGGANQQWRYSATSGLLTTVLDGKCVSTCL